MTGGRPAAPRFDSVAPPSAAELVAFRARVRVNGEPAGMVTMASLYGVTRQHYHRLEAGTCVADALVSRVMLWLESDVRPPEFVALNVQILPAAPTDD